MAHQLTTTVLGTDGDWIDTLTLPFSGKFALCGVSTPGTLTSTALSIEYSNDASTALALYDSTGAAISNTVSTNQYIALDPSKYAAIPRYFRIKLGSSEASRRTFVLYLREV